MKICFVMYPWSRVHPDTDSTLRLIHEAVLRGHTVAITTGGNLTMRESVASAFCKVVVKKKKVSKSIPSFYQNVEFKKSMLPLAGFDVIFMRENPPIDAVVFNFLDSVKTDTFIINDIEGLRLAGNKLYPASLDDQNQQFIPTTHVSKNKEYLERVLDETSSKRMIMKPLSGFGGKGVIVIEKDARQNFRSLLDFYIGEQPRGNYVILQDYVEGAENGDVRVLMLNGEPIGAMRRIPAENDIRSNVHAGGNVVKHVLTKEEKNLCKHIGPKLVRDGLYFVGIDIINGKLIEVNVCSPGGIVRINKLNRVKLQQKVIDFIENIFTAKEIMRDRKQVFRKAIDDVDRID